MASLRRLTLAWPAARLASAATLTALRCLQSLNIQCFDLAYVIAELTILKSLSIRHTIPILLSPCALRALSTMPRLQQLDVAWTGLTTEGARADTSSGDNGGTSISASGRLPLGCTCMQSKPRLPDAPFCDPGATTQHSGLTSLLHQCGYCTRSVPFMVHMS